MSTSYLLDSSVLVLFLQKDTAIHQRLANTSELYVSTIALGELYYGAEHSGPAFVRKSLIDVDGLTRTMIILAADGRTARIYGGIKHQQQTIGLMIPENDLWIAATAIQHNLTLAARDRHFTWVQGLSFEEW